MNEIEEVVKTTSEACAYDFSLLGLFVQASLTVKIIVILLLICSFWSWAVIFAKLSLLKKLKAKADKFEESFWNCGLVENFFDNLNNKGDDPFVLVFVAGMQEWRRVKAKVKTALGNISLNARINRMMCVAAGREIDHVEQHLGFLATVGSTAPFVGVLGTVLGIMNTFESMSITQSTNIISVAPGIAEALFTTALGLAVTIPAVVAYNKISSEINRYQNRLEAFIDEFSSVISRQAEDSEEK